MPTLTLRPTGPGNITTWSPSAGSNWQNVDESAADGDTTYNSHAGGGGASAGDLFTSAGGIPTGAIINSVTLTQRARHTGSSGFSGFIIRSGGTTQSIAGAVYSLTGSYADYSSDPLTENPVTAAAWTVAEVNALEFGYYDLSSTPSMRVTQMYAVVDYTIPPAATIAAQLAKTAFSASAAESYPLTVATQLAKLTAALDLTHTTPNDTAVAASLAKVSGSFNAFHGTAPALVIASSLAKTADAMTASQIMSATIDSRLTKLSADIDAEYDDSGVLFKNLGRGYRSGTPHFSRR